MKEAHEYLRDLTNQTDECVDMFQNKLSGLDQVINNLNTQSKNMTQEQRDQFERVKMMASKALQGGENFDKEALEKVVEEVKNMKHGDNSKG